MRRVRKMITWMFTAMFGHIEPSRIDVPPSTISDAQAAVRRADEALTVVRGQRDEAKVTSAALRSIQVNTGIAGDITTSMRRRH